MIEARLSPRKFKIEQTANEYTYFVTFVWHLGKWAVELQAPKGMGFMTKSRGFDYCHEADTAFFDTPEEALEFWKSYIEAGECEVAKVLEAWGDFGVYET